MLRDVVDTPPLGLHGPVPTLVDTRIEETLGICHVVQLLHPEAFAARLDGVVELLPRVDVLAAHGGGYDGSTLIHLVVGVALGEETDEDPTREEAYSTHIMTLHSTIHNKPR
jgi:hypothetical protein